MQRFLLIDPRSGDGAGDPSPQDLEPPLELESLPQVLQLRLPGTPAGRDE